MHYHIKMITHDMAFGEPVGGTGWEQVSDMQIASELLKQAELRWANHQTSD